MLLREDGDAVICIGQPAHAWLSGQLARAWRDVEPREEVCLAAEQHDIGMAQWDLEPELNPATGRPYSFIEMPLQTHLALWSAAPLRMLPQSRYAALLVSMHGTALYRLRDLDRLPPEQASAVERYFAAQEQLQAELIASLDADAEEVRRNQQLVFTWDFLSLGLCLRWEQRRIDERLDPWPFAAERVELRTEGRRLEGRYTDEAEMRAALAAAPWVTLRFVLEQSRNP